MICPGFVSITAENQATSTVAGMQIMGMGACRSAFSRFDSVAIWQNEVRGTRRPVVIVAVAVKGLPLSAFRDVAMAVIELLPSSRLQSTVCPLEEP